jgi:hypothetical protein
MLHAVAFGRSEGGLRSVGGARRIGGNEQVKFSQTLRRQWLAVGSDAIAVVGDEVGEGLVAACRRMKLPMRLVEQDRRMLFGVGWVRD